MAAYKDSGPIDCTGKVNKDSIKGKTAIITGGASGIGEAYVRALVDAGAFVVIADINEDGGKKLQKELSESTAFAHCDVTQWRSQLDVFKKAKEVAPSSRIDIVVANAGISGEDQVLVNDVSKDEPDEPKLTTFDINAMGVMYTVKLALFYFQKQSGSEPNKDQSLILQASIAGYADLPYSPQYTASKFAVRGLMRSLRYSRGIHHARVNVIAPWYIDTPIIGAMSQIVGDSGAGWATIEDAAQALLRIVGDDKVNGRTVGVLPRSWKGAASGFVDLELDDFEDEWWKECQAGALKPFQTEAFLAMMTEPGKEFSKGSYTRG